MRHLIDLMENKTDEEATEIIQRFNNASGEQLSIRFTQEIYFLCLPYEIHVELMANDAV